MEGLTVTTPPLAPPTPYLRPIPGVLAEARDNLDLTYPELVARLTEAGAPTSRGLLHRIIRLDRPTTEERALALAAVLDVAPALAFTHLNGDPYGGTL